MLTKKKILVVVGIIVAILITFYAGVLGMIIVIWRVVCLLAKSSHGLGLVRKHSIIFNV